MFATAVTAVSSTLVTVTALRSSTALPQLTSPPHIFSPRSADSGKSSSNLHAASCRKRLVVNVGIEAVDG